MANTGQQGSSDLSGFAPALESAGQAAVERSAILVSLGLSSVTVLKGQCSRTVSVIVLKGQCPRKAFRLRQVQSWLSGTAGRPLHRAFSLQQPGPGHFQQLHSAPDCKQLNARPLK